MGLFSKTSPAERLAKVDAKARQKAEKKGVDTEGALVVAHELQKDNAYVTLVVRPDRVEAHNHGKVASLLGSGAGATEIPLTSVSSVNCARSGVWSVVKIAGRGADVIEFRTDVETGPALREQISTLVREASA